MTEVEYGNLLYGLGDELNNDPAVDLKRLLFICRTKIAEESCKHIDDVFKLFRELEKSGDLSIDNLGFLKEVLQELQKHNCLQKVVAFEAKRGRSSAVEPSVPAVIEAAGGREDNRIAEPAGVALEQRDGGMNFVIERKSWGSFAARRI